MLIDKKWSPAAVKLSGSFDCGLSHGVQHTKI